MSSAENEKKPKLKEKTPKTGSKEKSEETLRSSTVEDSGSKYVIPVRRGKKT